MSRLFRYALALLVLASATVAWSPRPVVPTYAVALQVDTSAPEDVRLQAQVTGDSMVYESTRVLAHVCIPVVPDSAGATMRLLVSNEGHLLGALYIVFYPSAELPEMIIRADSSGVHVRRSAVLTCSP